MATCEERNAINQEIRDLTEKKVPKELAMKYRPKSILAMGWTMTTQ